MTRAALIRLEHAIDLAAEREIKRANFKRLGTRERAILEDCLARAIAGSGTDVPWVPKTKNLDPKTARVEQKALYRALRTLEERGLLVRLGRDRKPGVPCHAIRLTVAGIKAARRCQTTRARAA